MMHRNQRASYQAALSITEDIGTAVGPVSGLAIARATVGVGVWVVAAVLSATAGLLGRRGAGRTPEPQIAASGEQVRCGDDQLASAPKSTETAPWSNSRI